MKRMVFIIIITITAINCLYSQVTEQWVRSYNGNANSDDNSRSIALDKFGNIFVTGSSKGIGTYYDFVTVKYNSMGLRLWEQRYSGTGNSEDAAVQVVVDDLGNAYVTGSSGIYYTGTDIITIKYDVNGDSIWVARYDGPEHLADFPARMALDQSGNVYVTGFSGHGNANYDFVTIKYDSAGMQQWAENYNGPGDNSDYANSIAVDAYGNVYVSGYSAGTGLSYDYATIKYNTNGNALWVKRYDGGYEDQPHSIAVDTSGNLYVTGKSQFSIPPPVYGSGHYYTTIKYDSSGTQQWIEFYNSENLFHHYATCIAVDDSGNVFVSGWSQSSQNNFDYATIKYNTYGSLLWTARYDETSSDRVTSMEIDDSGNVYVTGVSGISVNTDFITIKYNSSGVQKWIQRYHNTSAVSNLNSANDIAVDNLGNAYVTGSCMGQFTGLDFTTIKYSDHISNVLTLKVYLEGFYNSSTDIMLSDTMKVYLRNAVFPYEIVDSSKAAINQSGVGSFVFNNAVGGINYYLVLKHRNSIETWSSSGIAFISNLMTYDFSLTYAQAYGNNLKKVDDSPVRYGVFSGDVNQDGSVNLTDLTHIHNSLFDFQSGYLNTNLNGDDIVDLTDLLIAFNNSYNFVGVIRP